jgi:hypothetical protein
MLCKISGIHGSDYEECRLLGYKNPVHTSQETHTCPLQSPAGLCYVRFEVFTAVNVNNVVFWDIKNPVRTSQETITSPLQSSAS